MDTLERAGARNFNPQDIIRAAGHQEAFLNFRMFPHSSFEPVEVILGLPLQRDVDNHGDGALDLAIVDQRRIPADDAGFFQELDAPETRGGRQPDFRGQCRIADPPVQTKEPEKVAVDRIYRFHAYSFKTRQNSPEYRYSSHILSSNSTKLTEYSNNLLSQGGQQHGYFVLVW